MALIPAYFKNFLGDPADTLETERKSLFYGFKPFLLFDLRLLLIYGLLISLMSFLFEDFEHLFKSRLDLKYSHFHKLLLSTLVAPLIEEMAFRLGLKINKINIALMLGFQLIFFLILIDIITYSILYKVLFMLVVSSVSYFLISDAFLNFLKRHFNYFVYYNILMFGLAHAFNYTYDSFLDLCFVPVLIIFQLVLGAYLCYVRVRYGFFNGLVFHAFHNLILTSITLLLMG
jgi:hypothetical protein